jgi:hypothetical protein
MIDKNRRARLRIGGVLRRQAPEDPPTEQKEPPLEAAAAKRPKEVRRRTKETEERIIFGMVVNVPAYGSSWEVGSVLILLGFLLWLGGARFTTIGVIDGFNWTSDLFGAMVHLPALSGAMLISIPAVGAFFSRVEIKKPPIYLESRQEKGENVRVWVFAGSAVLLSWLVISGIDLATTYYGMGQVTDESWPIHRAIASNVWSLGGTSVLMTYAPEFILMAGGYFLGFGRKKA